MEAVRAARPEDVERCRELLTAARDESAVVRGGDLLARQASSTAARWLDSDPDRLLLVGLFDEVVVGVAVGEVVPGRLGRVGCCYVEPEARQVGVGSGLVAGLLSWFADRGCTGVDAQALPGDRSTKQLLETAGFKARLLILHRRLP
ncbi:MAG TPA: GNAT family N-acetyltransferase [Acidimicrobiales bacterium]|nr:GNAT family N-acetyltransferase [Acidimicrobiales bacterium]